MQEIKFDGRNYEGKSLIKLSSYQLYKLMCKNMVYILCSLLRNAKSLVLNHYHLDSDYSVTLSSNCYLVLVVEC